VTRAARPRNAAAQSAAPVKSSARIRTRLRTSREAGARA
jgi:hypothetical protein